MLVYLDTRLTKEGKEAQRREEEALRRAAEGGGGGGGMEGGGRAGRRGGAGTLLSLTCGHNTSFSEGERAKLMYHLAQGWTVESFAGP